MPHHKSAEKRLKTTERDRVRNMAVKSELRKELKKARGSEKTPEQVGGIYASLDRAARKGVIPKQRASRLKSRIALAAKKTAS
jgi:small subunit ribosomal protein S20